MQSKWFVGLLALSAMAVLSSCSGQKNNVCVSNCGGGNASLTISLVDTPPTGTSVLSFTLPIAGISLTSSGSPVAVTTAVSSVEVTRLQSDSTIIVDQASVLAGAYTGINVTLGPTSATNNVFINTSGATITSSAGSCANLKVCTLPVGAIFTASIPLSLTLNANQNQWIGLDFNLGKAITSTGGISVDFSQTGVLTATTTSRIGTASGAVDSMEDFIGAVTAASGTSLTVKSGISGVSLTAAINSNTAIHVAPSSYSGNCSGPGTTCVAVGSIVSVDAQVSSSGVFTATEIDVLDDAAVAATVDEVEGVIYSVVGNSVGIVLADKTSSSGNSILGGTTAGTGIILDVGSLNPTFSIDTKTLTTPLPAPTGFTGTGDLFAGQVIRAQVTNFASGSSGVTGSAQNVLLRFSRLSGTIGTVSGSNFVIGNLPSYVTTLNPALGGNPSVGTYLSYTIFDGVTATTDAGFTGTVSIRALYLHNAQTPFQAAKVRVP